jgi:hypothetical protein
MLPAKKAHPAFRALPRWQKWKSTAPMKKSEKPRLGEHGASLGVKRGWGSALQMIGLENVPKGSKEKRVETLFRDGPAGSIFAIPRGMGGP